jgi:MFS family permease
MKEGVKYLIFDKKVRHSMQSLFLVMAGLGAMSVVTIVFVQESFGSATKDLGLLGTLIGVGLFIGSILYGRTGHKFSKVKMAYLSFAASGVAIAAFVFVAKNTHSLGMASVFAVLLGVFASPIVISSNTLIHEAIPQGVRGRVFSSAEAVVHVAFLFFMLVAAKTSDLLGRSGILIVCGMVFVVYGLAGYSKEQLCRK